MNTLPEENFVEPGERRGMSRSTPGADQPGLRPHRAAARDADVDHLDVARVLLARPHPQADLRRGGTSPWPRSARPAPATSPVDRVDAGRDVAGHHRRLRGLHLGDHLVRRLARRAATRPCRAARRRSGARGCSRPASNGIGASPGQLLQLRLRVLAQPLGRPDEQHLDLAARPGAAAARPRSRRRRCCPCRRRSRSARPARAARPGAASPSPARSIRSRAGDLALAASPSGRAPWSPPPRAAAPSSGEGSSGREPTRPVARSGRQAAEAAQARSRQHRILARVDLELAVQVLQVRAHGLRREHEVLGDLVRASRPWTAGPGPPTRGRSAASGRAAARRRRSAPRGSARSAASPSAGRSPPHRPGRRAARAGARRARPPWTGSPPRRRAGRAGPARRRPRLSEGRHESLGSCS